MPSNVRSGASKKRLWFDESLTKAQKALVRKHGSPEEFAAACYACCPSFISMDEARKAVDSYNRDWEKAGATL